ncbi:bleomycin resistance protein [[Clostridium] dakarense]|uniref:bleomycin resistance protein n=1 Tax=Faecalimicrobium dakarense TaxID=1301100 RepID=UPI0004B872A6|nr:VOC family protein [[Clostridium] dakarense]
MKFNALIPELSVLNIRESKAFYIDILGFKLDYERVADKFAFISLGDAQIMLEEVNGYWNTGELEYPFGRGINFQIDTTDIDTIINKLKINNIDLFRDVAENMYNCNEIVYVEKEILVQDPNGYLLRFSQSVKQINESK